MCATLYPAFERALKPAIEQLVIKSWNVSQAYETVIDSVSPVPRTATSTSPSIGWGIWLEC
jgi:hypothetical protein